MSDGKAGGEDWGEAAHTYDADYRRVVGEAFENDIRCWLARQFTDADDVLELGCGTGIYSAMITDRVHHLTATDSTPEMLNLATQRLGGHENVETRSEDACHTSFADGSFSAVLAVNLMHHADEPPAVARECHRVVKPGGRAVIIDCAGHGTSLLEWVRAGLRRLVGRQPEHHHHDHFSPDDLAALLAAAGFTVQETTQIEQRRPRMKFTCLCAQKA